MGAAVAQTFDHVVKGNMGVAIFVGEFYGHMAVIVHTEEIMPPRIHAVEIGGFLGGPRQPSFRLGDLGW